jgi:hypothetical protein
VKLLQGGAVDQSLLVEHKDSTDYEACFMMAKASLSDGSVTDKIQYMGESTSARVKNARLISLQLPIQTVEVEFTGSSNTLDWTQLAWTVDSAWTTPSVTVTLQLYNYNLGQYPTSGDGYISYTSSATSNTDETQTQTITSNPTYFRDTSGNWRVKVKGVKSTTTQFDFKADLVKYDVTWVGQNPIASFTYSPVNPFALETVTFNASTSYDPDGNIVSYKWDFGDGNITTVADPIITHSYENCGNLTVTLTVTDNEALTSSVSQIVQVINPSLLRIWADVGSYVGSNPDEWIKESWVVSSDVPAGGSVSFNLYIDAISNPCGAHPTYDVYLAVAVNDTAQVASITIGSTTITTFTYGQVTWPDVAGGGTLSPHGVYPTWYALAPFGDVASNHGYYTTPGNPYGPYWAYRAYIPVTITASSTMNAGFKVHFDAQGVLVRGSTKPGYRNYNPFSHDLTFEGSLYTPPIVQYYLTVKTDPLSIVPISGEGWYDNCTYVNLTAPLFVPDEAGAGGERYRFANWTVDGDFVSGNPITVYMDANHTAVAHYVKQYKLIMSTNFGTTNPSVGEHWYDAGSVVSISATAPTVIDGEQYVWLGWAGTGAISYTGMVNPSSVTMNSPITETAAWRHEYRLTMVTNFGTTSPSVGNHWYEAGTSVPIQAFAPSVIPGEQYVWNGWTGTGTISYTGTANPSSVTMNSPISEIASWTHQFLLTINTNGLSSAYPTRVYLAGSQVGTASDTSPYTKWFDAGTPTGTIGVDGTISGATGTRYVFVKWVEDSSTNNPRASETMGSPKTFTAEYKTQYEVSFTQTGSGVAPTVTYTTDTDPTGSVPFSVWVKAGSQITYEYQGIVPGASGVRYVLLGATPLSPQTVTSPLTIIGSYKTQYQITVTASPSGALGGTFKVTYTQCGTTYTNVLKTTSWTEWADGTTTVTVSEPQNIVNGYKFDSCNPSATVTMDQPKTITLVYTAIQPFSVTISPALAAIKVGESVAFTSTVSGGVPDYSYQWYRNGTAVSGAIYSTWTFTPTTSGTYNIYLNVTDSTSKTAKSNVASVTVAPPLTVSISPTSATILVGQSVGFTSTVSGGYPGYSYQWYLGGIQVSGATSASWTFTSTTSGIYYVYLQVKDANNNIAQSETAKITVTPPTPVGGYSISLAKRTPTSQIAAYTLLIALFGAALSLGKRKRK